MRGHGVAVLAGDCIEVMAGLDAGSVDAIVCDPPYGLEFMGRAWDSFGGRRDEGIHGGTGDKGILPGYGRGGTNEDVARFKAKSAIAFQDWCTVWASEAFRVLKPGGHLLAFGGTRTYHRLTSGIENAGLEIRDSITWLYGSGFPKSLDVSKAIDAAAGAEREVIGRATYPDGTPIRSASPASKHDGWRRPWMDDVADTNARRNVTIPATDAARQWQGWGTALKPASEPIVVARKPLAGTVAGNVLAHGTGALNIDACRVPGVLEGDQNRFAKTDGGDFASFSNSAPVVRSEGRWPSNVILTHTPDCPGEGACVPGCPVADLDDQSGIQRDGVAVQRNGGGQKLFGGIAGGVNTVGMRPDAGYDGTGGASRFFPAFRYEAKAASAERPSVDGVAHPTVKPVDLMRWLVRLVTPPGGHVLDPFAGSGTTGEAALLEGFACTLIERDPDYLPLVAARLDPYRDPVTLARARARGEMPSRRPAPVADGGLLDLIEGGAA